MLPNQFSKNAVVIDEALLQDTANLYVKIRGLAEAYSTRVARYDFDETNRLG
jgi:hypothetical protein